MGFRIFSFAGIPVSVSGWYLLLVAWTSWSAAGGAPDGLGVTYGLLWATALTSGLLIHEFGHALAARHFALRPQVLLHGWGGLCAHDRAKRDLHDVIIISAGPLVELAFGILCAIVWYFLKSSSPSLAANPAVNIAFTYLIYINVVWAFINLVPLWPLDGGQLFRLAAVRLLGPRNGEKVTHYLGIAIGVAAAALGYEFGGMFLSLLCLLLVYENYTKLSSGRSSGPVRASNRFASELFAKAQKAMEAGDWREAARLGHQIRAESNVPDTLLDKVWGLLAVSTVRIGEYEDALSYIKRAPPSPMVAEAHVRCLAMLGRADEARKLLDLAPAAKLPEKTKAALSALIDKHGG